MRRAVLGDIFYLSDPKWNIWNIWNDWEGQDRLVPNGSYPLVWEYFHGGTEESDPGVVWRYYLSNLVKDLGVGK